MKKKRLAPTVILIASGVWAASIFTDVVPDGFTGYALTAYFMVLILLAGIRDLLKLRKSKIQRDSDYMLEVARDVPRFKASRRFDGAQGS